MRRLIPLIILTFLWSGCGLAPDGDPINMPYLLRADRESRSISFENPTGEKGGGGKAASNLGVGRKGAPAKNLAPGERVELCNIEGPGVIRHLWMTTREDAENLRGLVIRAYWEGQEYPSIECPVGDLMGFAHGKVKGYESAVHSVGPRAGLNLWLAMPFSKRARITLTNEMPHRGSRLFYQIDYTLEPIPGDDFGRLHALFRRENPTTLKQDFEILPKRTGKGRYLGCVLGIRSLNTHDWWGEGEVKIYLDGDTEFPTICGTGSEDYVGLSWGVQDAAYRFNGCSLNENGYVSMYRWHLPDPVYWREDCRVTIQQLGWVPEGCADRQDDWSAATFWYEPVPSAPLPRFSSLEERTANLPQTATLARKVGAISPLEAAHLMERELSGLEVTSVKPLEESGLPLYEVGGKTEAGEAGGYVHAETARVLVKVEKGKQPERLDKVWVAAHRGANKAAPENTLAAIRKAVEFGADLVEIDIRQTQDGRLVLMHNATLEKTTNGMGAVWDKTLEELRELDAGSWFGPEFQGERIPTLEEVFEELRGKAYPDFDLKSASPEVFVAALRSEQEKTPDLFEKSGLYCGNLELRKRVVELEPRLRVRHTVRNGELGLAEVLSEFDPPLVNVEWADFTEVLIRGIHLAGRKAVVNTHGRHDTEFKMNAAIEAGADIIMTDHPELLIPLLKSKSLHD